MSREVKMVRYDDLKKKWTERAGPGSKTASTMYVGGVPPAINWNRGEGIDCDSCSAGTVLVPVGNVQRMHRHPIDEIYIVMRGQAGFRSDDGKELYGGPLTCFFAPSNVFHGIRNVGLEELMTVWFQPGQITMDQIEFYPDEKEATHGT